MTEQGEKLFSDYWFESVTEAKFRAIYKEYADRVFATDLSLDVSGLLCDKEKIAIESLQQNMGTPYSLNFILYCRNEIIGWMHGKQTGPETFYMVNTGIKKLHRNKGLYSQLLPRMMEIVMAKGFQIIYSKHAVTNNQVIIPKLKKGFIISGLEISGQHGVLVVLSYFSNPVRRKAMDFRAGLGLPDEELLKYFPTMPD